MDSLRTKKRIALDCEMVDVGTNLRRDIVARVSLVDEHLQCVYDKYVKPTKTVTDYRTAITGITKLKLEREGIDFNIVQRDVKRLIAGCVVVGHSLDNDFKVLDLDHPDEDVIDTSRIDPFKSLTNKGHTPALKFLAQRFLYVNIQQGQHSSITDAKVAMKLSLMAIPKRQ